MLNEKGERELAYLVKIDDILPIEGADRVETAVVGGWHIMVHKEEFKIGDIAVYFEIDSKVPEKEPFMFLEPKHFKIKTQKYFKGTVLSQGLLMSLNDFTIDGVEPKWVTKTKERMVAGENVEHTFLTKELGVTYATAEDNQRKGKSIDKYQKMIQRNPKIFNHKWAQWMMNKDWGKKIMFFLFGKEKDGEKAFPNHLPYITRSDEERCENLPSDFLQDKTPYRKTLKIDGTSTLFLLEKKSKHKFEFWVCSRNIRILNETQETFHDTNVYWEMAHKYDIENKLKQILNIHSDWEYVAIQGETAGVGCQGNPHHLPDTRFYAFNFIDSKKGRWDSVAARDFLKNYNIPFVPIIDEEYILPDDFEELKLSADGPIELEDASGQREGFVYRSSKDPLKSFKNVSREYLLKHDR